VSVEAIGFLPPVDAAAMASGAAASGATGGAPAAGFGDLFAKGLSEVNSQLVASQSELQGLALGDAANLHQVMIRLEETRLAFQLMVQVRNRLLEAYQDVMRMQI
jgi:flagellar hook-basal body complex protein FliE